MDLTRKDFLLLGVTLGTGLVAEACGSDSTPEHVAHCSDSITDNHGHKLDVAMADVQAGVDKTYDIQGTATHTHQVLINSAAFADLKAGHTGAFTSTAAPDGHTHDISLKCG